MGSTTKITDIIRRKDAQIADLKRQNDNLRAMIFGSTSEKQSVMIEENPKQLFLDFEDAQQIPLEDKNPAADRKLKRKAQSLKRSQRKKAATNWFYQRIWKSKKLFLMSQKMKSLIQ